MPGTPFYSERFDMGDARALLVEARLLEDPPHPPAPLTVLVQGSNDGMAAERKCLVNQGYPTTRTENKAIFHNTRDVIRVVVDPLPPGGRGRLNIRLTRLP